MCQRLVSDQAEKKPKKGHKKKWCVIAFTMPQIEYQKIAEIKAICLKAKYACEEKRSVARRAEGTGRTQCRAIKVRLNGLEKIKTGRPKKH